MPRTADQRSNATRDFAADGLRVAVVLDAPRIGGAERVALQIAGGAAGVGATCFLYLIKPQGDENELPLPESVTVRRIAAGANGPLDTLRTLSAWIAADGPHVVHAHNSAAFAHALGPARWNGRRVVITRHGRLVGRRTGYERLARLLYPFADRVVHVARTLDDDLPATVSAQRVAYIPNGVSTQTHDACKGRRRLAALCTTDINATFVLCVGTISAEKNQAALVRAMRHVAREHPNVQLVLAGGARDESAKAQIVETVRSAGMTNHVHAVGPQDNVGELMAGCDLCCLPSKTEAMPLALLEAMVQSCPVVATAVGDIPNALRHEHEGLLVRSGDDAALADALCRLLRDRAYATTLGEAARDRAKRDHADQRMIDRHLDLYAALAHKCTAEAQPHVA